MSSILYPDTEIVGEPTLDEMFAEPIIRLIMQRDGIEEKDMRTNFDKVRDHYKTMEKTQ